MVNLQTTTSNEEFLVITSLTGTDREEVLQRTQGLQPPVPPKGSPDYQTFLQNFIHSPANVISTVSTFLQNRVGWEITSDKNFQDYLNSFNGAPFIAGVGSGTNNVSSTFSNIPDLLLEIYVNANIPKFKRATLEEAYGLQEWFEGDFENTPKSLTIITQNLEANDGNLKLIITKCSFTVSYFPPEKKGFRIHDQPSYNIVGSCFIVTMTVRTPSFFVQNGAQFLAFGFVNVTTWIKENSTPQSASTVCF